MYASSTTRTVLEPSQWILLKEGKALFQAFAISAPTMLHNTVWFLHQFYTTLFLLVCRWYKTKTLPCWNTFSFSEYTGVEQVEITFNKQSEHSCVSEIELTLSCDLTDADGDGVAAWEDCDDNNPSIITGTGTSERCAGTSCKTILDDGASTGNGTIGSTQMETPRLRHTVI